MSFEHRALNTERYLVYLHAIHDERFLIKSFMESLCVLCGWIYERFSVINAKNIAIVLGPTDILISHELITSESKRVLGSLGVGPLYF